MINTLYDLGNSDEVFDSYDVLSFMELTHMTFMTSTTLIILPTHLTV